VTHRVRGGFCDSKGDIVTTASLVVRARTNPCTLICRVARGFFGGRLLPGSWAFRLRRPWPYESGAELRSESRHPSVFADHRPCGVCEIVLAMGNPSAWKGPAPTASSGGPARTVSEGQGDLAPFPFLPCQRGMMQRFFLLFPFLPFSLPPFGSMTSAAITGPTAALACVFWFAPVQPMVYFQASRRVAATDTQLGGAAPAINRLRDPSVTRSPGSRRSSSHRKVKKLGRARSASAPDRG